MVWSWRVRRLRDRGGGRRENADRGDLSAEPQEHGVYDSSYPRVCTPESPCNKWGIPRIPCRVSTHSRDFQLYTIEVPRRTVGARVGAFSCFVASNSPEPRETESVEKLGENEAVTKHGSFVLVPSVRRCDVEVRLRLGYQPICGHRSGFARSRITSWAARASDLGDTPLVVPLPDRGATSAPGS